MIGKSKENTGKIAIESSRHSIENLFEKHHFEVDPNFPPRYTDHLKMKHEQKNLLRFTILFTLLRTRELLEWIGVSTRASSFHKILVAFFSVDDIKIHNDVSFEFDMKDR
jgi:hypothetical protein